MRKALEKVARLGWDAFKPRKLNPGLGRPEVPPRIAAKLRKRAYARGEEWPYESEKPAMRALRKPKGRKRDREAPQRKERIRQGLKRAEELAKQPKAQPEIDMFDKLFATRKERIKKMRK